MNILLINHYAGSPEMGMEFRPYYFAREWVKMGHKVDIIAASFSHIRRVNPEIKKDFELENIDGINYWWLKSNRYEGNGVKRTLTMASFISKLMIKARWIVKNMEPDVVICSSTYPLDTYVGQKIRKISKKKVLLVHEVHDMWPLSPIEIGGMSPKHPFIRVMQRGENSFCKNADLVVSLLPANKDYFIEHGMKPEHFRHIPNGIVLEDWENYDKLPIEISNHFIESHNKGLFNLCFFGSVQKSYNLELLIDAVKMIECNKIMLTIIGPGSYKEYLKDYSNGYEDRITFFDTISKKCIPDLFNYIDASYVGVNSQPRFRFGQCMNKVFDAMMGAKPILYMVDAPNNYIKDYGCGITVEEQTKKALIDGIYKIINISEQDALEMGHNGRNAVINKFNFKKLALCFIDTLENAIKHNYS